MRPPDVLSLELFTVTDPVPAGAGGSYRSYRIISGQISLGPILESLSALSDLYGVEDAKDGIILRA